MTFLLMGELHGTLGPNSCACVVAARPLTSNRALANRKCMCSALLLELCVVKFRRPSPPYLIVAAPDLGTAAIVAAPGLAAAAAAAIIHAAYATSAPEIGNLWLGRVIHRPMSRQAIRERGSSLVGGSACERRGNHYRKQAGPLCEIGNHECHPCGSSTA